MDLEKYYCDNANNSISISHNGYVKLENLDILKIKDNELYTNFIEPLLKNMKKLQITNYSKSWFYNLPNYITELDLQLESYKEISLDNLHNGLRLLSINNWTGDEEDSINKPINNLPQTLEHLLISSQYFNQSIDLLPLSLKSLCIYSNRFNQSLSNLPINLEYLLISRFCKIKNNFTLSDKLMNLPENLKKLKILDKLIPYDIQEFLDIMKTRYPSLKIEILGDINFYG